MYFLKTDPRSVNTQNVNDENMENKKYGFYLLQAAIIEFALLPTKKSTLKPKKPSINLFFCIFCCC